MSWTSYELLRHRIIEACRGSDPKEVGPAALSVAIDALINIGVSVPELKQLVSDSIDAAHNYTATPQKDRT